MLNSKTNQTSTRWLLNVVLLSRSHGCQLNCSNFIDKTKPCCFFFVCWLEIQVIDIKQKTNKKRQKMRANRSTSWYYHLYKRFFFFACLTDKSIRKHVNSTNSQSITDIELLNFGFGDWRNTPLIVHNRILWNHIHFYQLSVVDFKYPKKKTSVSGSNNAIKSRPICLLQTNERNRWEWGAKKWKKEKNDRYTRSCYLERKWQFAVVAFQFSTFSFWWWL